MEASQALAPIDLDQFKGVIFDLDGTLLDTLADIANAANSVLAQHGFPTHPLSQYRTYVGEGVRVLMSRALPLPHRDEATLNACLTTMKVEYVRHLNQTARPYPGIPELLDELRRRNLLLAVLSNKPDEYAAPCIHDFFGLSLFNPILGLRSDRPRKPDPAGAFEIAAQWGATAPTILYLGDSGTDMMTARNAGMFPVGALWGYRDAEELTSAGAQRLLKKPADLLV
jgi:phosphoglycolate phosphatase